MKTVNEKIEVTSYPYGRLRTSAFFSVEWKKGKGFRSVFQTINPKTGRLNAEKKGTYYDLILLTQDEKGFCSFRAFSFNGNNETNRGLKIVQDNRHLLTEDQVRDIALTFITYMKVSVKAQVIYCGSDFELLKPLYSTQIDNLVKIAKGENISFEECILDIEKIDSCKVPDFNPFTVKVHHA